MTVLLRLIVITCNRSLARLHLMLTFTFNNTFVNTCLFILSNQNLLLWMCSQHSPKKKTVSENVGQTAHEKPAKEIEKEAEETAAKGGGEGGGEEEGGEATGVKSHCMDVVENGGVKKFEKSDTPCKVAVNGQREHGKEEGKGEESASEEDSEGEEEGVGQPLEDEEEMKRLWGPLRRPVQVKIADLGNACWVVSE